MDGVQGNQWLNPPVSMTSRLATVTFKMAHKMFIEEMDENFEFITLNAVLISWISRF